MYFWWLRYAMLYVAMLFWWVKKKPYWNGCQNLTLHHLALNSPSVTLTAAPADLLTVPELGEGIQPALCSHPCNRRDVYLTFVNSRASPFHIAQKEYLQPQHFWFRAMRLNPPAKAVSIICEGKFPNLAILVVFMGPLCLQLVSTWIISANVSLCVILLKYSPHTPDDAPVSRNTEFCPAFRMLAAWVQLSWIWLDSGMLYK